MANTNPQCTLFTRLSTISVLIQFWKGAREVDEMDHSIGKFEVGSLGWVQFKLIFSHFSFGRSENNESKNAINLDCQQSPQFFRNRSNVSFNNAHACRAWNSSSASQQKSSAALINKIKTKLQTNSVLQSQSEKILGNSNFPRPTRPPLDPHFIHARIHSISFFFTQKLQRFDLIAKSFACVPTHSQHIWEMEEQAETL